MLTAIEYLGTVGIGVTSPQLFRANDGKVYVVKLQNNRMGPKVLVNEYVACWFGQRMQLCFPPSDLIELTTGVLEKNRRLRMMRIKQGPHFASQYLHHNRYVTKHDLQKAINKDAMAGVMLFDHMFHNVDRTKNRRNLLVRHEEKVYVLYAIDNSHLFVRGRWNEERLEKLTNKLVVNHYRAYGWLLKNFLSVEDFAPYVARVKGITKEELIEFVHSIPSEWLLKDSEREALLQYMTARCTLVDDIAQKLYQSIPDINRRTYPNQRK